MSRLLRWGWETDILDENRCEDLPKVAALANAWPRYWARMLDLAIEGNILLFLVGILLFLVGVTWPPLLVSKDGLELIWLAIIPIAMAIESGIVVVFGNTLGKAIAGIRIETTTSERPAFRTMLARNLRCWIYGLALGIPLINLIAMSRSRAKVTDGKLPSWDDKSGTRVVESGSSMTRTIVTALLFLLLVALNVVLESLQRPPSQIAETAQWGAVTEVK